MITEKRMQWSILILLASSLLFACTSGKVDVKITARIEGRPAADARVTADREDLGLTGPDGTLTRTLERNYDTDVTISVVPKEQPGFRIKPWKGAFPMKRPSGSAEPVAIKADLDVVRFFTVLVTFKGTPVKEAAVKIEDKVVGMTDANGAIVYEYKDQPQAGITLSVTKPGYAPLRWTAVVLPGQRVEAALIKRVTVIVQALAEEYGQAAGIPGVAVSIQGKEVGKTDAKGGFSWMYDGDLGKQQSPIELAAPGYIPETWKTARLLDGDVSIQRYFISSAPQPIRTGIFRFAGNTPNVDLNEVISQTEAAFTTSLFKYPSFRKVPSETIQADMKRAKLSIDKLTTKGWRETVLKKTLDLLILGSVARDERGLLIEAKFYTSGGILIMSQIARAKTDADVPAAAREIAAAVMDRFPFEGTVVAVDDERYRVNLGKASYRIAKGADFIVMAPSMDESGKVSAYSEAGRLRVKKIDDSGSWAEIEELKKDARITVGDRVVRRIYREGEDEGASNYVILTVKGGLVPDVAPLAGVNIYRNNLWLGTTGPDGKAEVPVPLNKSFTLVLYRHGYQQLTEKVSIEQNKETREFTLAVNNALFRIDSDPRSATVFVDEEKIGKTPLLDGKPVALGFHTVKVSLGDDYRDWEEVVEFARTEENRTNDRKIVLARDYLKIGDRALQKNDIDGAITAYRSTDKAHPDYSEARHRLARIYLDDKEDYDGAIREFENVLAVPGNQQLVYKQYAVAFMNLGHAYYEKGSTLVLKSKDAAAQSFAKAIQNLQVAKQNTRFFPTERYEEAVHDTYYYMALAYHKLYLVTRKNAVLNNANLAWQEYFDFFPKKLEGQRAFEQSRESAKKYWGQIGNQ